MNVSFNIIKVNTNLFSIAHKRMCKRKFCLVQGRNEREELKRSYFNDWTGHNVDFEQKDNLTNSTVLNTGEAGDIYCQIMSYIKMNFTYGVM